MDSILHLVRPHCVTSAPLLVGILLGNLGIAICYMRIPWILRRLLRAIGDIPGAREIRGTKRFVGWCGLTHLSVIVALFFPAFDWPAVFVMLVTVLVSADFAIRVERSFAAAVAALKGLADLHRAVDQHV